MPIYWPPDCYSQLAGKGLRFEGKSSKYQTVVVFFLLTNGRLQPYCDLVPIRLSPPLHSRRLAVTAADKSRKAHQETQPGSHPRWT